MRRRELSSTIGIHLARWSFGCHEMKDHILRFANILLVEPTQGKNITLYLIFKEVSSIMKSWQ